MADGESFFELEDGEVVPSVVQGGPSAAADADARLFRTQLHEAATVLRQQGQRDLARLALGLVEADLRDATWVLNDPVRGGGGGGGSGGDFSGDPSLFDAFRYRIRMQLLYLQEAGYGEDDIFPRAFPHMVLDAARLAAEGRLLLGDDDDDRGDGFRGAVVAAPSAAALEKQTFHAALAAAGDDGGGGGVTEECSICLKEFVDGGEVSLMPCPSHGHRFHPDCIAKWLGISSTCPLCRHQLYTMYDQ